MADQPGGLFSGAGFTLPAAAPDAATPAAGASLFGSAGFTLPGVAPQAAPAAEGGYYVPWLGKTVATSAEYQRLLSEHVNSPATPPVTFRQKAQAEAAELQDKITSDLSKNFWAGAQQAGQGVGEVLSNRSAAGVGNALMGSFNATIGNVLSTAGHVISDTVTNATGNKDFGEKAPLLLGAPVVKAVARTAPTVNALNKVVEHIAEGGPQAVSNAINTLRSNPSMTAMDVSPGVETTAIGIAKGTPSKGQTLLFDRAAERTQEAPTNIMQAYDTGMGKTPNTVELLQSFKDNARKVGQEQIQPALDATGPVDVTRVINHIDSKIDPYKLRALQEGRPLPVPLTPIEEKLLEVRQNLTYRGKDEFVPKRDEYYTDATGTAVDSGAHGVQSQLRREADTLSKSSQGGERLVGGVLGDVRGKLVDAIDRAGGGTAAMPGSYKQALSAYRDEMDVQNAFDKGQEILSGARVGEKGMANRPEAFQKWMDGASDHEVAAARLGARTIVDNYIGTSRNQARLGKDLPEAPFTDSKIKMLFGEEEGQQLVSTLRNERRKAEVNANLTKQSITARALAAQAETAPREVGGLMENAKSVGNALALPVMADIAGGGGLVTGALAGAGLLRKGYQMSGRAHDIAVNNQYARIASSTEAGDRNALLQALESKRAQLSGGKKPLNALAASLGYLPSP